jgi:hypothetical protein
MNSVLSERVFQCEICTNEYNNDQARPHLLVPCGHTFCESCILQIENRQCPNDRTNFSDHIVNWEIMNHLLEAERPRSTAQENANSAEAPMLVTEAPAPEENQNVRIAVGLSTAKKRGHFDQFVVIYIVFFVVIIINSYFSDSYLDN